MFTGNKAMVKFLYLKIFMVFSSFPFKLCETKLNHSTAVNIDHGDTDGVNFVKKIVHGAKISDRPEYMMFTAPYRLCEGECKTDSSDIIMAFPIYIGKKGKEYYKALYHRDFEKIHSVRPNAPFKRRTTRPPFTTCPTYRNTVPVGNGLSTNEETQPTTLSPTETEHHLTTNTRCPEVVPRHCKKRTKTYVQQLSTNTICPDIVPFHCITQIITTQSSTIKEVEDPFSSYLENDFH